MRTILLNPLKPHGLAWTGEQAHALLYMCVLIWNLIFMACGEVWGRLLPVKAYHLMWHLLRRKMDVDAAAEKLVRMMEWRKGFLGGATPIEADVAEEAATGKAYLHTRKDINGRPVIIVRASRHITGGAQPRDLKPLTELKSMREESAARCTFWKMLLVLGHRAATCSRPFASRGDGAQSWCSADSSANAQASGLWMTACASVRTF